MKTSAIQYNLDEWISVFTKESKGLSRISSKKFPQMPGVFHWWISLGITLCKKREEEERFPNLLNENIKTLISISNKDIF